MKHLESFLAHLEAEQLCSPHTVEAYSRDLTQFGDFCTSGECDPEAVTPSDIRAWLGTLSDEGRTPATLRRKLQSIRAFYHWGMKLGIFSANPGAEVTLPKKRKRLPNFIKEEEMEQILDAAADDFTSMRSHIIVELLYSLGLRRAELMVLTDADVSFSKGEIRITGKRNKQRVVPLPQSLAADIHRWQEMRDERYPDLPRPAAIAAGPHGALSANSIHVIVRDALAGASSGRKSPHTLRHTFATSMVNSGANLDAVREMLGHESLSTTQIYTHLSVKQLLEGYRAAHPRAHAESAEKNGKEEIRHAREESSGRNGEHIGGDNGENHGGRNGEHIGEDNSENLGGSNREDRDEKRGGKPWRKKA